MHQAGEDLLVGQPRQVRAGLAEAEPAQRHLAHPELSPHQVIEGDAAGDDISAGIAGAKLDLLVSGHGLDRLCFYQGQLSIRTRLAGKRAGRLEIPIPFQPLPGHRAHFVDRSHPFAGARRNVNRDDTALRHRSLLLGLLAVIAQVDTV